MLLVFFSSLLWTLTVPSFLFFITLLSGGVQLVGSGNSHLIFYIFLQWILSKSQGYVWLDEKGLNAGSPCWVMNENLKLIVSLVWTLPWTFHFLVMSKCIEIHLTVKVYNLVWRAAASGWLIELYRSSLRFIIGRLWLILLHDIFNL